MDIVEVLGLDSLLAQLVLAIGAAMILGNGFAIYQNKQGKMPKDAEGEFRASLAWWLLSVGVVIALWGLVSLVAG